MDDFWHLDRQRLPSGMGRGERVAGNAVGLRTKIRISGIGEPALLARMGVNPLLDVWQLLRPIDTGVAQVFCVCLPLRPRLRWRTPSLPGRLPWQR